MRRTAEQVQAIENRIAEAKNGRFAHLQGCNEEEFIDFAQIYLDENNLPQQSLDEVAYEQDAETIVYAELMAMVEIWNDNDY